MSVAGTQTPLRLTDTPVHTGIHLGDTRKTRGKRCVYVHTEGRRRPDVARHRRHRRGARPPRRRRQPTCSAASTSPPLHRTWTAATSSSSSTPTRSPSAATSGQTSSCTTTPVTRVVCGPVRRRGSRQEPRPPRGEGRHRHAPEEQARPRHPEEAEGLRGPEPSPRRAAAGAVRDQAGGPVTTPEEQQNVTTPKSSPRMSRSRQTSTRRGAEDAEDIAEAAAREPDRASTVRSRPSVAVRRPSSACVWCPAPATSSSTAAPSRITSRTRCTSS